MNLAKKLIQILLPFFLTIFLISCSETGCVEKDEFDSEYETVDSYPVKDGIYGTYSASSDGGQTAEWHDTGLKSSGEEFIVYVSGGWTPWYGDSISLTSFNSLDECSYCAKKTADVSQTNGFNSVTNCICHPNADDGFETSYKYYTAATGSDSNGNLTYTTSSEECTSASDQNDPTKCTCTTYDSSETKLDTDAAVQYGIYHLVENYYSKYGYELNSDAQLSCKLSKGMGLYIGLFGTSGAISPTRAYHMFAPDEEICNITTNSDGECVDDDGVDQTKYVFRSANSRIFMKDDKNDNDGSDTDTSDDEYHKSNEEVKIIIADSYYSDNYGSYTLEFVKGVNSYKNDNSGLIEFLVSMVEDVVLGEENSDGERDGGVIEFMYKAIVQDTNFILILQIVLSLYIAVYGAAHLFGVAEINAKELRTRALKIGLIMFFTSETSWNLYNDIVVGFFKDSMDYVVAMLMDLSDSQVGQTSSLVFDAQLDRATDTSEATRFSYIDLMIKKLLAESTAKKIWGLFFGEVFFGMVYIPIIYALIGGFILTMLLCALIYLVNMLKIVFVLALGPLFFCFTLFKQTEQMFKNWLAFLGARSLEIIMLFLVLYVFLVQLDIKFTSLFYYRACVIDWWNEAWKWMPGKTVGTAKILISYANRSLTEWFTAFINIGGLIFIMKLVVNQVPAMAGFLVSIGGVANKSVAEGNFGQSSFNLAKGMFGELYGAAKDAASKVGSSVALNTLRGGIYASKEIARTTGLDSTVDSWNKAWDKVHTPRSLARNGIIDSAINSAKADAKSKGFTGAAADQYIRAQTFKILQHGTGNELNKGVIGKDKIKSRLLGIDDGNITRRLDQKLVRNPLKKEMKQEAKKLRKEGIYGEEARAQLEKKSTEWANKNLYGGKDEVGKYLGDMKGLLKKETHLSARDAAKLFAGKEEEKRKYMEYLEKNRFERHQARIDSQFTIPFINKKLATPFNWAKRTVQDIKGEGHQNSKREERRFDRELEYQEKANKTRGERFKHFIRKHAFDYTDAGDRAKHLIYRNEESSELEAMRRKALNEELKNWQDPKKMNEYTHYANELSKLAVESAKRGEMSQAELDQATLFKKAALVGEIHGQNAQTWASDQLAQEISKKTDETIKGLEAGTITAEEARKTLEEIKPAEGGLFAPMTPDGLQLGQDISKELISQQNLDNLLSANNQIRENEQKKNSLSVLKNQNEGRKKINELEKKLKEHELAALKADPITNAAEIEKLEKEIGELEGDIKKLEKDTAALEEEIKTF